MKKSGNGSNIWSTPTPSILNILIRRPWSAAKSHDGCLLWELIELGPLSTRLESMGIEEALSRELAHEIQARFEDADNVRSVIQKHFS
jgi:hypothetical protein